VWLHNCKFVACTVGRFDQGVLNYFDISMFKNGTELKTTLLPNTCALYRFLQLQIVILQLLSHLCQTIHQLLSHFFVRDVQ
jgi:hypothetical protein